MNVQLPNPKAITHMPQEVMDTLLPMHIMVDAEGHILHAGPTCQKVAGGADLRGVELMEVFTFKRPSGINGFPTLMSAAEQRLILHPRNAAHMPFRGVIQPLPDGQGAIMNLSFGLSFARAVSEFSLTLTDFAATDQTIELLYLNEAKASTTRLSEHLTSRLQDAHETAQAQARTDVLTGLSNRRAMDDELDHLIANRAQDFTLMHLDLDLFKQVNDTHGHAAGDAVLMEIGRIMDTELRRTDFPARIGGDEFLIALCPSQSPAVIARIAKRLISRIEEPIQVDGLSVEISASIGVASTSDYATRPTIKELMANVDEALYAAKRNGRGQFRIFEPEMSLRH